MKDVEIVDIKKVKYPKNIKIYEIRYIEDNQTKVKEVTKNLDVVKILIYHKEKNAFVLVKQFRPLVYINHPELAYRYELCGGREDKGGLSSKEIAIEEVLEETGYKVKDLTKITTFVANSKMTLYYTEVDESLKVSHGGGVDYENIELFFLPLNDAKNFIYDESKPKRAGLSFSIMWFFDNKNGTYS